MGANNSGCKHDPEDDEKALAEEHESKEFMRMVHNMTVDQTINSLSLKKEEKINFTEQINVKIITDHLEDLLSRCYVQQDCELLIYRDVTYITEQLYQLFKLTNLEREKQLSQQIDVLKIKLQQLEQSSVNTLQNTQIDSHDNTRLPLSTAHYKKLNSVPVAQLKPFAELQGKE